MKLLMCAPTHYTVQYEINPWMQLENPPDPYLAARQWNNLYNVLKQLGAKIVTIDQAPGCPDMVFTANAGVVSGKRFIPSHFRFPQRRPEEKPFAQFFKRRRIRLADAAKGLFFEGEGDLLAYRDMLFGGFRFRSELKAQERVSEALGKRLVGLDLVQPRFYHLDTCFCPLDDRTVIYYPNAFDDYGRRVIKEFVVDPLPVSRTDAAHFACNAIRIGRTVILNRASAALKKALSRRGYGVIETPMTEFIKAGGSVKCLLLKL